MGKSQAVSIQRYRKGYAKLLQLYAKPFQECFSESMAQTFADILHDCVRENRNVHATALWVFAETSVGIFKEKWRMIMLRKKDMFGVVAVVGMILLIPLIAMQVSDEVAWGFMDFAVAGTLLTGTGVLLKLMIQKFRPKVYRAAFMVAIGAAFLLIWVNLAVGLIGSEENLANLMYVAVLAVAIVGTFLARLQPRGMALTLLATALSQAVIAGIALLAGMHRHPSSSLVEIVNINGFFVVLFLASAWLFHHAAKMKEKQLLVA